MATVSDVLAKKGGRVLSIAPIATVLEATQLMNSHKIGALVVARDGDNSCCSQVVGMFTERDVLSRIVAAQRDPAATLVEEVMSSDVAYCRRDTDLDEVAAMMRQRRIRHLPVCEADGQLQGLISIGDINAWQADGQAITINYLHDYIHGRA